MGIYMTVYLRGGWSDENFFVTRARQGVYGWVTCEGMGKLRDENDGIGGGKTTTAMASKKEED